MVKDLNTLQDVLEAIKNITNETDTDEQIESIIYTSINSSYTDLSSLDERVSVTYLPVVNGLVRLPDDIIRIISISPSLSNGERRIGNTITSNREGITFTIVYTAYRDSLIENTDEIDLSKSLRYGLVLYGASKYFDYKKKSQLSEWYLEQYNDLKSKYRQSSQTDTTDEEIVGDYYGGEDYE